MTRSAYVLACVLACLSGGHAASFNCETMTYLGLPSGCLLGLKEASYGTLTACKDVLCRKLLTDIGGNADWVLNPNGGCTLSPRGTQSVQDLICVSNSAIQPSAPTPVPDTTAPTSVPTAVPTAVPAATPSPGSTPATPAPDAPVPNDKSGGLPVWVVVCLLVFILLLCAGVVAYCWRNHRMRVRSAQPGPAGPAEQPVALCKFDSNTMQWQPMQAVE